MCNSCHRRRTTARAIAVAGATGLLAFSVQLDTPSSDGIVGEASSPVRQAIAATVGVSPAQAADPAKQPPAKVKWTCPMHPHYIADEFGSCPICGMDLVKLDTSGAELGASQAETRSIVTIAPEVIQNIGVRLGQVERSRFGRSIRSYGIVNENERKATDVTSRVEGWVQDLKVTAVGDEVKRGDLLFKLYSPRLIISQNDLFLTTGNRASVSRGMSQLRALGVQDPALEEIRKNGRPLEFVPFFADRTGVVTELTLKEGTYVNRGMMIARIQDYSSVWLKASVAEQDLPFITKSTNASVSFPNMPGKVVQARVDYVYPTIDTKTRTGQVRLVLPNPEGTIRPGGYADVAFEVDPIERIAVKSEAILRNGEGQHVIVSLGQGRFQPKAVSIGLTSDGWTEITSGLKAGEDIVLSGQFLIDSESALRESFRKLQRLQLELSLLNLDKTQMAMVDHIVDAALYLHEALVDGYDPEPTALEPAIAIRDLLWPRFKDTKLAFVLDDSVKALRSAQKAKTESERRQSLAALMTALQPWLLTGAPRHYEERKVGLFREKESGRLWLQMNGKPINPYSRKPSERIEWPRPAGEEAVQPTPTGDGNRAQSDQGVSQSDVAMNTDVTEAGRGRN